MPNSFKAYYQLCKPKVVTLMLITAWVGMLLAPGSLSSSLFILSSLGILLTGFGAACLNHILDRNIDLLMHRTANRPLPKGTIALKKASLFAFFLTSSGLTLLYIYTNLLTTILTMLTFIGYAVIYTLYLKRASPQNIVIGGLSGALPPVVGWSVVNNDLTPLPWLLVAIIFIWTPPHFWALAIAKQEEYSKAGIPMLPVTHGVMHTKLQILLYTILLTVISLLPYAIGAMQVWYLPVALLINGGFLYYSIKLYVDGNKKYALLTFNYSLWYLLLLFTTMLFAKQGAYALFS